MENQNQNSNPEFPDEGVVAPPPLMVFANGQSISPGALSYQDPVVTQQPQQSAPKGPNIFVRLLRRADVILTILLVLGMIAMFVVTSTRGGKQGSADSKVGVNSQYGTQEIPLEGIVPDANGLTLGPSSVVINGSAQLNGGLIIAPSLQPSTPKPGQLYYDKTANVLAYYDGTGFVLLGAPSAAVAAIGGLTGQVNLGSGLDVVAGQLANTGVLSVQGQTGAVAFTGGNGITVNGTSIVNSGVVSVTSANPAVTVANDGSGNLTLDFTGSGSGTVSGPGGTVGHLAKFSGSQSIVDSILTDNGSTVTVNGGLTVTGSLGLSAPLSVSNGGTGAAALTANGVLVGNGSGAITSVTAGGAGLCLVSTAGAPSWTSCTNSSNAVLSLNGQKGSITINDASGASNQITINSASTSGKGIAQFNGTNFSVSGGNVDTIQGISQSASPTFSTLTLTGNILVQGGSATFGTLSQAGSIDISDGNSHKVRIVANSLAADRIYSLPDVGGDATLCLSTGNCLGSAGGAPNGADYLVANLSGTLTNERALTGGNNITLTDSGANNAFTVATVQNPTFSTSVTTPQLQSSGALVVTSASGAVSVDAATTIELQDSTNVTGSLDVSVALNVGTGNAFAVSSGGAITAAAGITSSGTIVFSALDCTSYGNGGALTTNGSGQLICSDDDGGTGGSLSGSGSSNTIPLFSGASTLTDSIITQSGTTISVAGDLTLGTDLAVTEGGTGASSFTVHGLLYGNGSSALQVTAAGTSGQVLIANGSGVPTFVSFTGDLTVSDTGVTTIQGDAVALGTDTTGNYVANVSSANGGIVVGGSAGEGWTPSLTLTIQGGKGLEVDSNGLSLIDCSANQILKYNGSNQWACAADDLGAGDGGVTTVGAVDTPTTSADGAHISGTTLYLQSATASVPGLVNTGAQTFAGAKTFNSTVAVQGASLTVGTGSSTTGSLVLQNATNNNTVTVQSGATSSSYILTLPTAVGSANQCLKAQNGIGALFWDDCEGGTGGVSGVTTLNSLDGALIVQGTTNHITVSDNGTDTITLDVGSSVTLQGNTFNGANQLVQLNASGELPALSGVNLTNLNASNLASGTVDNARLTNGGALTLTPGTGLSGGGSVSLGGSTTLNLADTAVTLGSYGSASQVATFTVDQQGRLTAAGNTSIAIAGTQIISGTIDSSRLDSTTVTLQGNTFNGANQLVQLNASGELPILSGVNLTNLNASNLASGTVDPSRISGSYTGVTGVGTIAAGTWQGNTVDIAYGGTGATSFTSNGVLYGNGTGAIQATTAGTTGQCLVANTGAAPSWTTCTGLVTLQNAYVNGNTISTTGNNIAFTLNTSQSFTVATATANTTGNVTFTSGNTSGTQTNGVLYSRNGSGGTTTNGINITNTAGTLTNGLAFTGTIGTDIQRASGTLSLNGASGITLAVGGSTKATIGANDVTLANNIDLLLQGTTAYISNPQGQTNAEAFGLNATVGSTGAVAVGNSANATLQGAIAIGLSATTTNASFGNPIAIGMNADASNWGVVIGSSARTSDNDAVAVGHDSEAELQGVAIGSGSYADGFGLAFGYEATTNGNNSSIVIGTGATATAGNQLVLGGSGNGAINNVFIGNGVTNAAGVDFTLQGTTTTGNNGTGAGVTVKAGNTQTGTCGTACNAGTLTLQGGNAANGSGTRNGGNVVIDAGTGATVNGNINIGTISASSINIGSQTLSSGTQNIYIGGNNTSGGTQNVVIGSGTLATGGTTLIQSKGSLDIVAGSTGSIGTASGDLDLYSQNTYNVNIQPGTTGDVVFTHGNGSQHAINTTTTSDLTMNLVDITSTNSAAASTGTLNLLAVRNLNQSGSTGTADSLIYATNLDADETVTNGLFLQQATAGGTLTNAIQISQSNGTLTSGILFAGTIGTDIQRASGTLSLNGASGITLAAGGSTKATIGANDVTLANNIDLLLQGTTAYISNPQGTTTSESFGNGASVNGADRAVAIGNGAMSFGDSVAIGYGATADSNGGATIIGSGASCQNTACTAVGFEAAAGFGSVALGYGASATDKNNSIALGSDAVAGAHNSIALGADAITTDPNQMVVGSSSTAITQVVIGNGATNASGSGFTLQGTTTTGNNGTGAGVTVKAGDTATGTCATSCTAGALTLQGGSATNGSGTRNGGNVVIDGGTGTTVNGSINIGANTNSTITLGTTSGTATITVGRSTASQTINIGNATTAAGNTQTINIATSATSTGKATVTIGNTNGASSLVLQSGSGSLSLLTNGGTSSTTGTVVQSATNNSTNAFRILNASSSELLGADTTNGILRLLGNTNVGDPTSTGSGSRLFSDDFESGSTKLWPTTDIGGTGTITADSSTVHSGKYSVKIASDGNNTQLITPLKPSTTVAVRGYVNMTSVTGTANCSPLWRLRIDSDAAARNGTDDYFGFYRDGATGELQLYDGPGADAGDIGTSYVLAAGSGWHKIEEIVTISTATTNGSISLYVDGTLVGSVTGAGVAGRTPISNITLGDDGCGQAATTYYDDIVIDTVRPGDSSNLNVADSLHVSGNSTFGSGLSVLGGPLLVQNTDLSIGAGTAPTALTAPRVTNTGSGFATAGTTHAVNMPATVNDDDLLVMLMTTDGAGIPIDPDGDPQPGIDTFSNGWYMIANAIGGSSQVTGSVWVKAADGTEGGTTVNFATGSSVKAAAQVYDIPGGSHYDDWGNISNAIVAAAGTAVTNNSPTPPALDPPDWDLENTLWMVYVAGSDYDSVSAWPSGYPTGTSTTVTGTGNTGASVASSYRTNTATSESPGTFTMGSSGSVNGIPFTIAIRPSNSWASLLAVRDSSSSGLGSGLFVVNQYGGKPRVGIGTDDPSHPLDIVLDDNDYNTALDIQNTNTGDHANAVISLTTTGQSFSILAGQDGFDLYDGNTGVDVIWVEGGTDQIDLGGTLVLNYATSDPGAIEGAMYYNNSAQKFRCYTADGWTDCDTSRSAYLTSDGTTTSSTSPTNVTGMSFSVKQWTVYNYSCTLIFNSNSTSSGLALGVTMGSAPTNISYNAEIPYAAAGSDSFWQGTGSSSGGMITAPSVVAASTMYTATLTGSVYTGGSDTTWQLVMARGGASASNVTLRSGSSCTITRIGQ